MDSFIRSKYESKRWAIEGSPPEDPSVLDNDEPQAVQPTTEVQQDNTPQPALVAQPRLAEPSRHQLLSSAHLQQQPTQPRLQPPAPAPAPAPVTTPTPAPAPPQNDLFSLDFHAPTQQQAQPVPQKNSKQDILSLFSTPAPNTTTATLPQQNQWNQSQQPMQQQPIQGMVGQTGTGMWGVSSGWNLPQTQPQANVWGGFPVQQQPQQPQQQQQQQGNFGFGTQPASNGGFGGFQQPAAFSTTDIWANKPTSAQSSQPKDAFDDIWGGFK